MITPYSLKIKINPYRKIVNGKIKFFIMVLKPNHVQFILQQKLEQERHN